ncbi:MAG: YebC/PmpR family DNA-binding transcriptional regulator, partial [Lutimaribacter sp.]
MNTRRGCSTRPTWSGGTIDASLASQLANGFSITGTDEAAPGSVGWSYNVPAANLDFLAEGETIALTYTVTATDNNNRTVANVRSYFNKGNGNLGTSGSVEFMFDHTCNFRIPSEGIDLEEIELEFIDHGVEEVFEDEDGILLYAPFEHFGAIQKELENRSIEILSSGFERIPQLTKKLTEEQQEEVLKL